jgi:hypothetical protein
MNAASIGAPMSKTLQELRESLLAGQRLAKQGSYERRAPEKKAVPYLVEARTELREYVREHEQEAEAWRLLSLAEECLLGYPAARRCLERAMAIAGKPDKKDLKRLALLKEYDTKWAQLSLTPDQLAALGRYLERSLVERPCDHTLRHTENWLRERNIGHVGQVLQAIRNEGAFCDCEVVLNVV